MKYNKPTSYSQDDLFYTCPRTWYMKYIQKIPKIDDLTYAHRGNVVHHCLENYYPEKTMQIQQVKDMFNLEWNKFKLDSSHLSSKKEETWGMIVNGISLDLDVTSTELKIFYPDVVGYIDVINTKTGEIRDWKSSTRASYNEISYKEQLKFYAWLYYRKFKKLPTYTGVEYLKYSGDKSTLGFKPTMEDIKTIAEWHYKAREKMEYYMSNPEKLPPFNQDYYFSPYKHLWDLKYQNPNFLMGFTVDLYGNFFYVKGMDRFLLDHFDKKYSYELKTARFIKERYPNANTTIRLFSKRLKRFPIGFYNEVMKSLHQYAEWKDKTPVLKIIDKRIRNPLVVDMPDKLLSGKEMRNYQTNAADTFISRNNVSILELTTGSGKSLIFTELIRRIGVKTLVVVDKKELLIQTIKVLKENLKIPIGILGSGKKDIQDVTVATIQTLSRNLDLYKDYLATITFVVFDECHKVASKSYFNLGAHIPNSYYRLGTSATAKRDDGNEMMMHAVTGPISFSLTGQDLIEQGYLMKPDIFFIKYDVPLLYQKEMEHKSLLGLINEVPSYNLYYPNFIVENKYRNEQLLKAVKKHEGKNILILVKRIEHGKLLEKTIKGSRYIYGMTNNKERTKALEAFKADGLNILISTISIFAEGVDIPTLDVVINAAANKGDVKSIQVLGRVLRKSDGKTSATYYDFADSGIFFFNASKARAKAFKDEGYRVHYINF